MVISGCESAAADGLEQLARPILERGYVFAPAPTMRDRLDSSATMRDWPLFAASWNDLEVDTYLAADWRFRKRRYATFDVAPAGAIERRPHEPHHQRVEYNPLFGGVDRWFAPVLPAIGGGPSMRAILDLCRRVFGRLAPTVGGWHVEVHQFRIEALAGREGRPTPEGVHRDGVDYVLVLLVARSNIASGTTTVHELDGRQLGSFTLVEPFDAALLDDTRVSHGVTPVTPLDPTLPAFRDVLVVTFRRA